MPIKITATNKPDPFIMDQDDVNRCIVNFLCANGFEKVQFSTTKGDIDIIAEQNGWTLYVESRGSQARKHLQDTVFDGSQLWIHLCEQVGQFMIYNQSLKENVLLIMGNPDIPRIRRNVEKVSKSLDQLNIVRFWVQADQSVKVEAADHLSSHIKLLGLEQT